MRAATLPSPTTPPAPTAMPLDLRATPPSGAWRSTIVALERGDAAAWSALMPSLRALANRVAPAFVDVVSPDDVLGELALLAHERWLPEYVDRARRGEARVSVETFLRDRLRDHLRELRRRHQRRAALLAPLVGDERFVARPPRPDEVFEAVDLERRAATGTTERTVLTMRAAGYDQAEIAAATNLSRPTVSRRLAAIAALLVGLGLLLLAAAQWRARDPEPIAAEPQEPSARPASAGEVGDEASHETNTPSTDATSPAPNEDELRRELLDPWREVESDERPLDPPTTDTSELVNPFEAPLRIPEIFRGPRTPRVPTTSSPDLLDPFARSEAHPRAPTARRPNTNGGAADLLDPFTRPSSAMVSPRTPSPASTTPSTPSTTPSTTNASPHPSGANGGASVEAGAMVIQTLPWARVLVDGREVGNTPVRVEVPAGERQVELQFSNGVVRRVVVLVRAGETHRIHHDARAP